MTMIQRKFYLPELMYNQLQLFAKRSQKTITQTLREFIEEGIRKGQKRNAGEGAKKLLELARFAKKQRWKGPSDLSVHHDKYFASA